MYKSRQSSLLPFLCMLSVLKLEQSVQVLQLELARADQDAALAHRSIEVGGAAVYVPYVLHLAIHLLDFTCVKKRYQLI